jgi:hypothetical protein
MMLTKRTLLVSEEGAKKRGKMLYSKGENL